VRPHHLALRVADPGRSASFYAGLLGLAERARHHEPDGALRSVWLGAEGGLVLMLEKKLAGEGPQQGSGHLLAFAVDDLAGWDARLAAAGAIVRGRTAHTIYFCDPDGHRLGVSTYPLGGAVGG
jgi:catechol 2,3-dioxygenase-like lactoylglutathione lyase family enzyme